MLKIMENVIIGNNNKIYDNTIIYPNTTIGNNNIFLNNNKIGELGVQSQVDYDNFKGCIILVFVSICKTEKQSCYNLEDYIRVFGTQ